MSNLINILLQAEIDPKAISNIQEQINNISKNSKPIQIKFDVDKTAFKFIEDINKTITKNNASLTPKIDTSQVESGVSKITNHLKGAEDQASSMTKTTKEGFKTIREEIDLINKTPIKTDITYDYEKEQKSIDALADAREKSAARVRNEQEKAEQAQARASNKAIEDNYKQQLSEEKITKTLQERIGLYQQKMRGDMDIFADKNKGKFDEAQLDTLRTRMENLSTASGNARREMKEITIEMGHMSKQATSSNSMLANITENLVKFARFYIVGQAVVNLKNSIQDGIGSVVELDASLTELAKVSDLSGAALNRFTDNAYLVGKTIGRTGIEVVNATADFARMGFTALDSLKLAEEALLMVNVGDNISGIDDATSSIISALKGFNVAAEDSIETAKRINDMYNEVSNTMAVDTGALAKGVQRSSSVLHQAGVSMEETIGLLTGAYEVLQNMERSSVGLSTISQRLRAMDEDNNAIDGLSAKLESAFNDLGLTLMDTNGQIKDTYTILGDLAEIYPTLTDNQRAYIGELTSGKNRSPVLQAILSNWENVEKATESAINSAGSAARENEVYLDSIAGRVKVLESTTQSFFRNLIDRDFIKDMVSSTTTLIDVLDRLINNPMSDFIIKVGLMTAAWALLTKVWTVFNNSVAYNNIGNIVLNLLSATTSVGAFTAAVKAAGVAMMASPLFFPALIIGGITAVVKITDKYSDSLKNLNKKIDETSSKLNELQSEYDSLKAQEDLTEEQEVYLQLLEKEIERKKESLAIDKAMALQREFLNKETVKGGGYTVDLPSGAENIERSIESLEDYRKKLKDIDVETEKGLKQWEDISSKIRETEDGLSEQLRTIMSGIEALEGSDIDFLSPEDVEKLKAAAEAIKGALGIVDDLTDGVDELAEGMDDLAEKTSYTEEEMDELTKSFESITSKIKDYNVFLDEANSKEGLSAKSKENIISKYHELLPYIDDEKMLRQELIRIIEAEEEAQAKAYLNMMMYSKEFYDHKIKGNAELVNSLNEKYGIDLKNYRTLAEAKLELEASLIKTLGNMWSKYYNATHGVMVFPDADTEMAFWDSAEGRAYRERRSAINDFQREIDEIASRSFKSLNVKEPKKGSSSSSSKKGSSSSSSKKEEYKAQADAYAKINLELDRNNVLLQLNKTYQEQAGDDITKKIKLIEEEIRLNKERQGLLHDLNEEMRTRGRRLQGELSGIFNFEGSWDDNSITITNLDAIEGKSKKIEDKYKEILSIIKDLPKASQEWATIQLKNAQISESINELHKKELSDRLANSKNWIEKRNFYDDWGADNEILAWERVREYITDYYQRGIISHREYTDYILDIDRSVAAENKRILDEREKLVQEHIKTLNDAYSKQQDQLSKLDAIQERLVQIIRKRGEEEKKILDENHRAEMESLDERHNDRKKKYSEEIDLFRKMIQDKISALDEQYEEEDYLEQLNKEREQANEFQKRIDVLSLDDSLTARNKTIELQKQLADQNEKIAKMQQKKERDLLKKSLQDQLKDREIDAKDKEDIADKTYDNEKKRLEEDYKINKEFLDKKYSDDKVYAEAKEAILRGQVEVTKGIFVDIYDAFVDFENKFGKGMGILGDLIKDEFHDNLREAQRLLRETANLSQSLLSRPDSDRYYTDDEVGWTDPRPSAPDPSSRTPNYGVGAATGQAARDNEARLRTDSAYRASEIRRTEEVVRDRLADGMSVEVQEAYLKRLISGSYKHGGKITDTGLVLNDFHGTKSSPEWIFNDSQLKQIISDATLSAFKMPMLKMPSVAGVQGSAFQIDNLINIEGSVDKRTLPKLQRAGNDIAEVIKDLNKGGSFRPLRIR